MTFTEALEQELDKHRQPRRMKPERELLARTLAGLIVSAILGLFVGIFAAVAYLTFRLLTGV